MASKVKATRVHQAMGTLPRQNKPSRNQEIYDTKKMRALKKEGVPNYKVKAQQQGRENLWRAKEKRRELECTR